MAINKITDQTIFRDLVEDNLNENARRFVLDKITDQNILKNLAIYSKHSDIRILTKYKIIDKNTLKEIRKSRIQFVIKQKLRKVFLGIS